MLQAEATLMNAFVAPVGFLHKLAQVRQAFKACGYLQYCDETFVSMGHKLSAIDDITNEHTPPKRKSLSQITLSKLSSWKKGKGSPKSLEIYKENMNKNENPANATGLEGNTPLKPTSPPKLPKSPPKSSKRNARPIIEYEYLNEPIEIDGDQIQGIVSLRFERDEIQGDTPREILQRLHPMVNLRDIQNAK